MTPWLLLLLLSAGSVHWAADDDDADDGIPVIGRPTEVPFCGGSGEFDVSMDVAPRRLTYGDPLTLTLTIRARGETSVRQPPRRIDLGQIRAIAERFHIEPARPGDDRQPGSRVWEFTYRLRPRHDRVAELPGVRLAYHNPRLRPAERSFQTVFLDPIPLTIDRPAAPPPAPPAVPEIALTLAAGDMLRRDRPWSPPSTGALAMALLLPLLAAAAWLILWRWRNPDAARLARQRRSRAARAALGRLRRAERLAEPARAACSAAAVVAYLQQRLDLPVAAPTPDEIAAALARAGLEATQPQARAFFRECDRIRFGPGAAPQGFDAARVAERLILDVERQSCQASS